MKETSRAKSIRRNEEQPDWDSVEQHSSVQAHTRSTKTVKTKEAKDCSKSEAEMVDVMDTLQHVISVIQKEMANNTTFLQKGIDTRNTNHAMVALIIRKTSMSIAFSKQCQ